MKALSTIDAGAIKALCTKALFLILAATALLEIVIHNIAERLMAHIGIQNGLLTGLVDASMLLAILAPLYLRVASSARLQVKQIEWQCDRLLGELNDFVYVVRYDERDRSWRPSYASQAVENTTGHCSEEFLGNEELWYSLIHPSDKQKVMTQRAYMIKSKTPVTSFYRVRRRQSENYRWIEDRSVPELNEDGKIIGTHGIVRDITDKLEQEQQRTTLSMAVEQAAESIVITDSEGAIVYVNPAFERNYGYASEEIVGGNPRILKSGRHDGSFYASMWTTLLTGKAWKGRIVNKRKDGSLIHEDSVVSPVKDETGRIVNYVAVKRDITREVELEEQVRQAIKMEAVGRLAGGIAHDINNLLTIILGYCQLLMADVPVNNSGARDKIVRIDHAGKRVADLVERLLMFSRPHVASVKSINVNSTIDNLRKLLSILLGEDIQLEIRREPDLAEVLMDPSQTEQIIMNLCTNARDAMPQGGRITITTANVFLDEAYCKEHLNSHPGPHVLISVSDTGCGMPEEVLSHIFEPFYTTKETGKGTGLGLSTVYGIVHQCDGHIQVSSNPGRGTTFEIYLPANETNPAPETHHCLHQIRGARQGTILVVEDEPVLRELVTSTLASASHTVMQAADGLHALTVLEKQQSSIDLLLTDIIMPGISGIELAKRVTAKYQGIKLLYMSGYSDELIEAHGLAIKDVDLIRKPFLPEMLTAKIDEMLGSRKEHSVPE